MNDEAVIDLKEERHFGKETMVLERFMGSAEIKVEVDLKMTTNGNIKAEIVDAVGDTADWSMESSRTGIE